MLLNLDPSAFLLKLKQWTSPKQLLERRTTNLAKTTKVTIKRKTQTGFDVYQVNLKELQKGLEEGNDEGRFFLLPGDIVFVPERTL